MIEVHTHGTQWGVGHGGFHTQHTTLTEAKSHVASLRFVYDCGTKNRQGPLKDCITDYVELVATTNTSEIDLVVLSHFDYDHVSGVPWLSKTLRRLNVKVIRVLAPAITPLESLLLTAHTDRPAKWYVDLLADPNRALSNLFPGAEVSLLEATTPPNVDDLDDPPQPQRRSAHSSSLRSSDGSSVWAVIPYAVQPVIDGLERFVELLAKKLGIDTETLDFDSLLRAIGGDRKTLRTIRILSSDQFGPGGVNANSVCLWAGPDAMPASGRIAHEHAWPGHRSLPDHSPVAWLGTGDATLRGAQADAFVNYYGAPRLGCVAYVGAPHHGSRNNSDAGFWAHFRTGTRVTTHAQNLYGHPHTDTVEDITAAGLVHVLVNQLRGPTRFSTVHSFDA